MHSRRFLFEPEEGEEEKSEEKANIFRVRGKLFIKLQLPCWCIRLYSSSTQLTSDEHRISPPNEFLDQIREALGARIAG
jgi:hypothetical protein